MYILPGVTVCVHCVYPVITRQLSWSTEGIYISQYHHNSELGNRLSANVAYLPCPGKTHRLNPQLYNAIICCQLTVVCNWPFEEIWKWEVNYQISWNHSLIRIYNNNYKHWNRKRCYFWDYGTSVKSDIPFLFLCLIKYALEYLSKHVYLQAYISMKRISKMLLQEEIDSDAINYDPTMSEF